MCLWTAFPCSFFFFFSTKEHASGILEWFIFKTRKKIFSFVLGQFILQVNNVYITEYRHTDHCKICPEYSKEHAQSNEISDQ